MELNFAAVLHCRNVNKLPVGDLPQKNPFCVAPNLACMWVDPLWTGTTCEVLNTIPAKDNGHSTLFHAKWTVREIRPSTIQSVLMIPVAGKKKKICNSIKIHFFNKSIILGKEERRDFLYSAAFPLETVLKGGGGQYGVFCVAITPNNVVPLKGVRLDIIPVARHVFPALELCPYFCCPEKHHERLFKLAYFFRDALVDFRPDTTTLFVNFRSIFRDMGSSWFFQDIHKLFQTKGSCLPATVAVYAMCNALMINATEPQRFIELIRQYDQYFKNWKSRRETNQEIEQTVLLIIRAVVACYTMCNIEGRYWDDKCGDVMVEDQPFPMTFMEPADRVFPKDDCEGRAAQIQQMVELLISLHDARERIGLGQLSALIKGMSSSSRLHVSQTTFVQLVDCCCRIGYLLKTGAVEVHTTIGEARFRSFSKTKEEAAGGHSFSMAFSGTGMTQCIIESTGWERSAFQGEMRRCYKGNIRSLLLQGLDPDAAQELRLEREAINKKMVITQDFTDVCLENTMYQTIYMTHDYIFFTCSTKEQQQCPKFGAKLETMRQRGLKTFSASEELLPGDVFRIRTRDFILQMMMPHGGLWRPRQGAEDMLKEYDLAQKDVVEGRQCLRPPPKEEEQIERIMLARWGVITEEHMQAMIHRSLSSETNPLIFSIPNDSCITEHHTISALMQQACAREVLVYPFMGSRIFCSLF